MHTREEMSLVPHFLLRTEKGERRQRPSRRSWLSRLSRRRRRVLRLSCRHPVRRCASLFAIHRRRIDACRARPVAKVVMGLFWPALSPPPPSMGQATVGSRKGVRAPRGSTHGEGRWCYQGWTTAEQGQPPYRMANATSWEAKLQIAAVLALWAWLLCQFRNMIIVIGSFCHQFTMANWNVMIVFVKCISAQLFNLCIQDGKLRISWLFCQMYFSTAIRQNALMNHYWSRI